MVTGYSRGHMCRRSEVNVGGLTMAATSIMVVVATMTTTTLDTIAIAIIILYKLMTTLAVTIICCKKKQQQTLNDGNHVQCFKTQNVYNVSAHAQDFNFWERARKSGNVIFKKITTTTACLRPQHNQTSFLEDVKRVFRVLTLYIPVPVFWALFDQQVR